MNCSTCKAKIPTLASRLRKVNGKLWDLGLTYHEHVPHTEIDGILKQEGFEDTIGASYDGHKLNCSVGDGKWLHVSWYRMQSGRYEIVAYVN